tara:strand:- start:465 stop:857 length:393 start_codon:yes stop_codon:yes gene_type:complete
LASSFFYKDEGVGWRVARDHSRGEFCFLIGGQDWAIELTENEWRSLYLLVNELIGQFTSLKEQLMDEEQFEIELEKNSWWGRIYGENNLWSLKLIYSGDGFYSRGLEIFWPVSAAHSVTAAMRTMWECHQ